ncbi:MAG: hypothetical protein KVP17_002289 [Porospora cf. gigantea B]|uniref:uncharacterized protein n=1 Tax=Porospora cf. gigantea B TaxID=2853592 RepID=UPI003571AF29|nr:MAG: hypothetical protein KVP17_002289 [Porospora cf. gigantea B]
MPRDRKRPRDDDSDSQDETVMLHTRGKDDYPESFNQGSAHAESSSESDADFVREMRKGYAELYRRLLRAL